MRVAVLVRDTCFETFVVSRMVVFLRSVCCACPECIGVAFDNNIFCNGPLIRHEPRFQSGAGASSRVSAGKRFFARLLVRVGGRRHTRKTCQNRQQVASADCKLPS